MGEKNTGSFSAVGGSSLLVIFAVLCLTVFAMLSLSTVQAGTRLSRKGISSAEEYYRLDTAAEQTLAKIRGGSLPQGVTKDGSVYSYSESETNGTQKLEVSVRVTGQKYEILRWQLVSTAEWQAGGNEQVWDGN